MAAAVVLVQSRIYYIVLIFLISRHHVVFTRLFAFSLHKNKKQHVQHTQEAIEARAKLRPHE